MILKSYSAPSKFIRLSKALLLAIVSLAVIMSGWLAGFYSRSG
jgi:hypothetical protein